MTKLVSLEAQRLVEPRALGLSSVREHILGEMDREMGHLLFGYLRKRGIKEALVEIDSGEAIMGPFVRMRAEVSVSEDPGYMIVLDLLEYVYRQIQSCKSRPELKDEDAIFTYLNVGNARRICAFFEKEDK